MTAALLSRSLADQFSDVLGHRRGSGAAQPDRDVVAHPLLGWAGERERVLARVCAAAERGELDEPLDALAQLHRTGTSVSSERALIKALALGLCARAYETWKEPIGRFEDKLNLRGGRFTVQSTTAPRLWRLWHSELHETLKRLPSEDLPDVTELDAWLSRRSARALADALAFRMWCGAMTSSRRILDSSDYRRLLRRYNREQRIILERNDPTVSYKPLWADLLDAPDASRVDPAELLDAHRIRAAFAARIESVFDAVLAGAE